MTYQRIVAGTDGSATASAAIAQAATLAAQQEARLVLVSAFEATRRSGLEALAGTDAEPVAAAKADARGDLAWTVSDRTAAETVLAAAREASAEAGVTDVVVLSDAGDPAAVILEAATLHRADLIVVGSVGLAGAERFLLGSVAAAVLHHAPCDVLVAQTT